jgi:cytochrome c oxidase subunit 2
MQVDPHRKNDLMWTFNFDGVFNLTSTEYSGPAQYDEKGNDLMFVKNAVKVVGCDNKGGN